jgi:uncharacterized protein
VTNTLIIPGIDGSPAPHWQHWWTATDHTSVMVEQDDWADPVAALWEVELAGMILRHPGSILVAHSLGCVLAARLLRRWPQVKVAGVLLVAPADPAESPRLSGFGTMPRGTLGVPATVVASRNDPWMSYPRARAQAADWGADLVDLGFACHINAASGYGPWPEGLKLRDRLLDRQPGLKHKARFHSSYAETRGIS